MKNNRRVKNRGTLLGSHHFEGRGACWNSGMRLGRMTSTYSLIRICTNQTTHWLVHSLSTFGARTSHEQLRTHKTHHALDLGEATTFPLIVFSTTLHGGHIQMAFCLGSPEIPTTGISTTSGAHNFTRKLWLRWGIKQSYSPS
jgi:hypothetical protein